MPHFVLSVPASRLEVSLGQSEQRVCELSRALSENEDQLTQLQTLSQSQEIQIQQLQEVCTQLGGVREMNEVSLYNHKYVPNLLSTPNFPSHFFFILHFM